MTVVLVDGNPAQGPEMGRAILALYPSVAQPAMAELGRGLPAAAARPGPAIAGTEGLGHWWMAQDPKRAARVLTEFWAEQGLDQGSEIRALRSGLR